MLRETLYASAEYKFIGDDQPGLFTGYASVFDKLDDHRDVVLKGAFADSLTEYKSSGSMPTMYVNHEQANPFVRARPVGRWLDVAEDANGLHVKGQLGALDCESGREVRAQIRDGLLPGLSIAYAVPKGGAIYGKGASEPARQLKQVKLYSIDIVGEPSNQAALIDGIKSIMAQADRTAATSAIVSAMQLHQESTAGGDAPSKGEREQMMQHLQDAHTALTGQPMPNSMKNKPEMLRQFEDWLQDAARRDGFKFTNSEARAIAERGFKTALTPRDEVDDLTHKAATEAVASIATTLAGFSLTLK
jgi:HK97 family phage prohead protease